MLRTLLPYHGVLRRRQFALPGHLLQRALEVGRRDVRKWFKRTKLAYQLSQYEMLHAFEPRIQIECGDEGFDGIGQESFFLAPPVHLLGFPQEQELPQMESLGGAIEVAGVYQFGLHLGETSFGDGRETPEKVLADDEAQHRVTQMFELFVLVAKGRRAAHPLGGEGTMRKGLAQQHAVGETMA